jgi:hypothetical protein
MKTKQQTDKDHNLKKPVLAFRIPVELIDKLGILPGETPSAAARRIVMKAITE